MLSKIPPALIFIGRFTWKLLLFTVPSIILAFLLCEGAVRLFLQPSDSPDVYFEEKLGLNYVPNQEGIYIKGREISAKYHINNFGWNSPRDYFSEKPEGTERIAVIGDSFVEAFQVGSDKAFGSLLEKSLENIEVYSLGHSGANLVQYLHIIKYAKEKFSPDLYVVNVVDNDFDESFYGFSRKDNWSLVKNNGSFTTVLPEKSKNLFVKRLVRKSALARYLTINLDFINNSRLANKLFYSDLRNYQHSVRPNYEDTKAVVSFILDEYQKEVGGSLILVLNAESKYQDSSYLEKRNLIIKLAKERGINLVDLNAAFKDKGGLIWEGDYHWTQKGHTIVAQEILKALNEAPTSLRSGYLLHSLRREQNPPKRKNSSPLSIRLHSGFSAKAD